MINIQQIVYSKYLEDYYSCILREKINKKYFRVFRNYNKCMEMFKKYRIL